MNYRLLAFGSLLAISLPLANAAVCPSTASTNSDCGYLITIGSGGSITGAAVAGATPYDGADDALIGVINNSGSAFNGSFTLTGSGNGGGLFAFDGDGICAYVSASYCTTAPTGYEGPLNTFTNIMTTSVFADTGTVVISNLAAGGTTYFSLESSPASINNGGGPVIGGSTPEPATLPIFAAGLSSLALLYRKRRSARN